MKYDANFAIFKILIKERGKTVEIKKLGIFYASHMHYNMKGLHDRFIKFILSIPTVSQVYKPRMYMRAYKK